MRTTPAASSRLQAVAALAGNVNNYLYRQSATTGESVAVLTNSDWSRYQSIEADITPTAFDGADRYVGLAVRYQDVSNNYYVVWRSSNVLQLKRKVNGVYVTLAERAQPLALNVRHRLRFLVEDSLLKVDVDGTQVLYASDTTFSHGRAALLTYRARADFDNVYVSPTAPLNLNVNDWVYYWYGYGRPFTTIDGNWHRAERSRGFIADHHHRSAQPSTASPRMTGGDRAHPPGSSPHHRRMVKPARDTSTSATTTT
jgi:hypothetical protein